ncbi:hypothetical protein T459_11738 [Capsicum annuum]|uniref:Uncharacterized protein n=1 Tax=Capsicum annuum TaxID=4072 RepID=A0A2G2ZMX7_CAPAN|nr:hypothetical protein FXO37_10837 [Capsicum annuum]PHT83295.1 hypothetical protein T459_11738 [Capsicum annuum]
MLKKLRLAGTYLSCSYLDVIAELPNHVVLKLSLNACPGEEWDPNVRGFNKLKHFLVEYSILEYWEAMMENFLSLSASCLDIAHI